MNNETVDNIFSHTDGGRDIFKRFLMDWDGVTNRKIESPFTGKKSISMKLLCNGRWIFNDWVGQFKGDGITFVSKLYNCTFRDAIDIISSNLNITITDRITPNATVNHITTDIHYQWCIPREEDMSYWTDGYGIPIDFLRMYGVHNVSKYRKITVIDDKLIYGSWIYGGKENPIFIYKYPPVDLNGEVISSNTEKVSFYSPLNPQKQYKFQGNKGKGDIFGIAQCINGFNNGDDVDVLYIFGGQKDVINAVWYFINVHAIALQSETSTYIAANVLNWIKSKYKEVRVIYDNDDVGHASAITLCDLYGFSNHTLEFHKQCPKDGYKPKDISDYIMAGIPVHLHKTI